MAATAPRPGQRAKNQEIPGSSTQRATGRRARRAGAGRAQIGGGKPMTTQDTGGKQPYSAAKEMGYVDAGLKRETGWWGAFVIGLAGTILVTGIAPVMVTSLGAASIPVTVFITLTGWLLCLFLAELSAMMPERTGGSPTYAYPAYKDRWPRLAKHINGFTAWAYWLGWFPVAPLNMILASFYIVDKFNLSQAGFTPIHTPIAWWTLGISIVGLLLLFIPAYL